MNIDSLSPCIVCRDKKCGLIDGNECSKCNDFLEIKHIVEYAASESGRIVSLYNVIKSNTYVCDVCGKIIFPVITASEDGRYDVVNTSSEIRGGLGNEVVYNHICSDCVKNATLKS